MKTTKTFSVLALSVLALTSLGSQVFADDTGATYDSKGMVQFIPSTDPTDPVDPTNPDPSNPVKPIDPSDPNGEPEPGTKGPLSIDYASTLDFGLNEISNHDETYFARAQHYSDGTKDTPNFVQISDNRGTNSGWTLTVAEKGQLTATTDTLNKVLTGSEIKLTLPTVNSNAVGVTAPDPAATITLNPDGSQALVMAAKSGAGAGTWSDHWGSIESVPTTDADGNTKNENVTKAVTLTVPGSTPKDAVKYQTTLNWVLTDTPAN